MELYTEILNAQKRIQHHVRKTPLEFSSFLSKLCNCNVYLKLESEQLTGSFKIRGALNKILSLGNKQRENGVIAYSTGNHALAVAYVAKLLNLPATIFVPFNVPRSKLELLKYYPVQVRVSKSSEETEITKYARRFANKRKIVFVSPYNDIKVIAGQGTVGYEILNQLPEVDAVFVCVGGGGLISGISSYLKKMNRKIKIIGCSPKNSAPMYHSIKAGKVIDIREKNTISDGSAGNNEHNTITFDFCRKYVDDWDLVKEEQIKKSILLMLEKQHKLIEGAAAVPVASLIKNRKKFKGKNVVLVICGSNISIEKLKKLL